jgi:hypothetical protein
MKSLFFLLGISVLLSAVTLSADASRPNVLLILVDDQGYGDLSLHGSPHLKTTVMDSL